MSSKNQLQQQAPSQEHRKHPCVLCAQRKVKCDRNEPCKNCTKMGVECVSATTLPPRKVKRRFPEAELLARIRRYEHHLKDYGADLDAINSESSQRTVFQGPVNTLNKSSSLKSLGHFTPETTFPSLSARRSLRHVESNLNLGVNDQLRDAEELLEIFSDDEVFENPITVKYDELGRDGDDVLFGPRIIGNINSLHPSPMHIFRLWQTFLDNINPLIKIFHAPSVQQKVLDAAGNLAGVRKNMEALMFGIYAVATISMTDDDCKKLFNVNKEDLMAQFQSGARQALQNARYLRSSDIVVLQAFILYLLSSLQMNLDPQSMFCLVGVAVRIAQRMGLSTDGTRYAIPPFEVEMRRRLWWQVVLIDMRVSEISGGSSNLNYTWNTKLPSNVNDSDLFPEMRDPPVERSGATEMMFFRIRCEEAQVVQHSRELTGDNGLKDNAIDEFENRLDREYLDHCDPSIPLHLMSTLMARSAIFKLRMGLRNHVFWSDHINRLSQVKEDQMFGLSLRMIENHNILIKNPSVQRFLWHIYTNFLASAHVYLFYALRFRTNDDLANKAWLVLSESAETRMKHNYNHFFDSHFFAKKKHSVVHFALGNMTVKAWEARETAARNLSQSPPPVPRFVSRFRAQLTEKKKNANSLGHDDTTFSLSVDQLHTGQLPSQFPILNQDSIVMGEHLSQTLFPSHPNDLPPPGWEFWNGMMQSDDWMQGTGTIPPLYNHFRS